MGGVILMSTEVTKFGSSRSKGLNSHPSFNRLQIAVNYILLPFFFICNHYFANGILLCTFLQPTVCERELCVFAFQTLGVMNEAADEIATGAQVCIHTYRFL